MQSTASGNEIFPMIFGTVLIILGLLGNEWTLSAVLCPEADLEQRFRISIRAAEIMMIGAGLAIIVFRTKDTVANLCLLLLTIFIAFSATEVFFRMFFPQITGVSEHQKLFRYDSELGWQFIPGRTGVYISKHEFKTTISINTAGMRDKEYALAKSPGRKRIVVLGDSFTSSCGVEHAEAFTEIMEEKLLKNTEVLNFGVNGYGPAQELLLLQKQAMQYRPDLVVMVIFVGNDFDDISGRSDWIDGYMRPKAVLDDKGNLHFAGIPVPLSEKHQSILKAKKTCGAPRLHFIDFIDKTLRRRRQALDFVPSEVRICRKEADSDTAESSRLMASIIRHTNAYCKKNGAAFMVAIAPTIVQVYDHLYWEMIKKEYHLNDRDYDLMLPNKSIREVCREAGIPAVDLTVALKAAVASGQKDPYYFKNQHWNKAGEQIAASALARFIVENQLL